MALRSYFPTYVELKQMDVPETYPTIIEESVTYIKNLKKRDKKIKVQEIKRTTLEPIPDILLDDNIKKNIINSLKTFQTNMHGTKEMLLQFLNNYQLLY